MPRSFPFIRHRSKESRAARFEPVAIAGLGNLAVAAESPKSPSLNELLQLPEQDDPSVYLTRLAADAIAHRNDNDYHGPFLDAFRTLPDGTRITVKPVEGEDLTFRSRGGPLDYSDDLGRQGYCKVQTSDTQMVGMGEGDDTTAVIYPYIRFEREPYMSFKMGYLKKSREFRVPLDVNTSGEPLFVIEVELPESTPSN